MTPLKVRLVGRATETSVARLLTHSWSRTLTQVVEADTARSATSRKVKLIGRATEQDICRAFMFGLLGELVRATETNTARSITAHLLIEVPPIMTGRIGEEDQGHIERPKVGSIDSGALGRAVSDDRRYI
jgi:hypothetical protein